MTSTDQHQPKHTTSPQQSYATADVVRMLHRQQIALAVLAVLCVILFALQLAGVA
jgi:hypothetical protein